MNAEDCMSQFNVFQETQSQSIDDGLTDLPVMRTKLSNLIRTLLMPLETASDISDEDSFQHLLLKCIRNWTDSVPDAFVPLSGDPEGKTVSVGFAKWIFSCLLRLLSCSAVQILHQHCIDTLISIIRLAKDRNDSVYRQFILPLIETVDELAKFNLNFGTSNGANAVCVNNYVVPDQILQKLVVPSGSKNEDVQSTFTITDAQASKVLQTNILLILKSLVFDIIHCMPDKKDSFWQTLCLQLETGHFDNKKISLDIVKDAADVTGLPFFPNRVTSLVNCIQALTTLFLSGEAYTLVLCKGFEESLAVCLLKIFHLVSKENNQFSVAPYTVYRATNELLTATIKYDISQIKQKSLREAFIQGLVMLLQTAKKISGSYIFQPLLEELLLVTLNNFGKLDDHTSFAPLFIYAILQQTEFDSVDVTSKTENLKDLLQKSEIWSYVHKKIIHLIDKMKNDMKFGNTDSNLKLTCAIASCINILFQSAGMIAVSGSVEIKELYDFISLQNIWDIILSVIYSPHLLTKMLLEQFIVISECVLNSQDMLSLQEPDYTAMSIILSIPWLAETCKNTYDLKFQQFSSELKVTWEKLQLSNMCDKTIFGLSMFPSDFVPLWRLHIFCYSLSKDDTRLQSVSYMSNFFLSLEVNYHKSICNSVTCIENFPMLKFAESIGSISCVSASNSVLKRIHQSETYKFGMTKLKCVCTVCDTKEQDKPLLIQNNNVILWLQEGFIHCINHSDKNVRLKAITNFSSFFAHVKIQKELLEAVLKLITDDDIDIRAFFSQNVKYMLMLQKSSFVANCDLAKILVTYLKTALDEANSDKNLHLQQTVLMTIGQIGEVADDELLLVSIISLIQSLKSEVLVVSAIARELLHLIAEEKALSMLDLYKKFKFPLGRFIMDALLECDVNHGKSVLQTLQRIINPFGFENVNSFLSNTFRHCLPYLVSKASPSSAKLIKIFAKQTNVSVRKIYANNFKYIFSYLVCNCSKMELEKALVFSQDESEIEIGSLLRYDYQRTHNELLLHMSTHYDQVFNGLVMLFSKDTNYQSTNPVIQKGELADFLQPRLLGFIAFFDSQLLNSYISLDEKKLALESFICVMDLMGEKHITPIRIKVMATLRIALRFTEGEFPKTCCKAWKTFVCNVELSSLGALLNQIMATLLPLLKLDSQSVSDIFEFLVVKNKQQLNKYFYDLYFIPDLPELSEVNLILKEYTMKPTSQSDFHSLITHSLKGVSHENIEVRLYALIKVKQLLRIHQNTLHEHLMGREIVDPLISRLLTEVMLSCRETDIRIQCLLAEVFGEIGAIDPGRLETVITGSKNVNFHCGVDDENFAFDLIQKLVHSFLAAKDSRTQDCSSYAIQELLQIYQCSDVSEPANPGNNLWKRFPLDVQEILLPLLQSKYIPGQNKMAKDIQRPIYGSRLGNTFKNWVTNWIADLVMKVKAEKASRVFNSCLIIAKYDTNCALYLLPYVAMYAIEETADEEREEMYTEVLTVLKDCEQVHPQKLGQFNQSHFSTQTVFSILDYLNRWIRHQQSSKNALDYTKVKDFVHRIPHDLLARVSYQCNAFARALMYLELHIRSNVNDLQKVLSFLQKLYVSLDEPDGVAGISAIRKEDPTLKEQIFEHEITGQMQEAFVCYERAARLHPEDVSYHSGLLRCLMRLDQPNTALTYASGLLNNQPLWKKDIVPYQIEAAWKLADWGNLKLFSELGNDMDHWNVDIGKVLLTGKEDTSENFWEQLKHVRSKQMIPISAASMEDGGYQRSYQYLTRLHMLTDLETGLQTFLNISPKEGSQETYKIFDGEKVLEEWKTRRHLIQASLCYQEPVLSLQRSLLKIAETEHKELGEKINHEMGLCWLESAKLARRCGHLQRAFSCLLEAGNYSLPQVFLEKAKWHWNKGEQEQSINTLQKGIQEHFSELVEFKSKERQFICARAKLMLARYSEESAIVESNTLLQMYQEVVSINPNWEDSYFYLAKYLDRVLSSIETNDRKVELSVNIIKNFGLSLQYGCKHVYHSMPHLLSLWFELGTQVSDLKKMRRPSSTLPQMEVAISQLTNKIIANLFKKIPPFVFLTAFPQLISRICHPHEEVVYQLQEIITKLFVTYPQQAMWMMIAVSKSSYPVRVHRCQEIFSKAKKLQPGLRKFIQDSTSLAEKLIELCNKQVASRTSLSISSHLKTLPRLIKDASFSPVMLPLQSLMMVTLPTDCSLQTDHNPFPITPVHIVEFLDTVEILSSLQQPKKVTIRGSDGMLYVMMCKPKDDLRKDCRLMEFNNLVNRCLKRDAESRKRQLHIRTYAVVPLNEECGLIEWIPNLSGLRVILNNIYKERGMYTTSREMRAMMPKAEMSVEQKLEIYKEKFLPRFPAVFAEWFLKTFPDPTAWYMARLSYARTTAVMSTVGYILGLGDRHGENILFDSSCGDTVHVDFNCLFNKGETFDWPERVPFRLTHNMIDAMGPTGYEGIFRKACEVTMRVMRSQMDSLMSVLKPFIHDPLVEWSKSAVPTRPSQSGEIHVQNIEQRLKGIVKSKNKPHLLPLSVEGQINYLILEATDEKNLCQMYVGWAAYM